MKLHKQSIVTGATRGIGFAIANHLLGLGHTVIGVARSDASITHSNYQHLKADLSREDDVKNLSHRLLNDFSPSLLCNVAGIASLNLALTTPQESTDKIFQTNLFSVITLSKLIAKSMISKDGGHIINFSSRVTDLKPTGQAIYTASKAALEAWSEILAKELTGTNVRINTIAPGVVDTDLTNNLSAKDIEAILSLLNNKKTTMHEILNCVDACLDNKYAQGVKIKL